MSDLKLAFEVHSELTQLIEPATAETIRSSTYRANSILKLCARAGFLGVLLLLFAGVVSSGATFAQLAKVLSALAGATLGAGFFTLLAASDYVVKNKFNPRYNQQYYIRFWVGVFAGFILGYFGDSLLLLDKTNFKSINETVMGLVGGFSAEAVATILQRFSDTLVTLVRGTDKAKNEADKDKKLAEARAKQTKENSNIASELQKVKSLTPAELDRAIDGIVARLTS